MRHLILSALALGLWLGLPASGWSADPPKASPPTTKAEKEKPKEKEKYRPFNGTVKAVNKETKTLTLTGGKAQEFQLTADTVVKKGGQPASWETIEAGTKIGGRARETADGKWVAVTITIGTKPPKERNEGSE